MKTGTDPWTEVLDKELEDSRATADPVPLQTIPLAAPATAQFVKFEMISFWGPHGGGLQFFDIDRP